MGPQADRVKDVHIVPASTSMHSSTIFGYSPVGDEPRSPSRDETMTKAYTETTGKRIWHRNSAPLVLATMSGMARRAAVGLIVAIYPAANA